MAVELLENWEDENYDVKARHLYYLMGIYNKLGQAEKSIASMNSIPSTSL
jgi:hypothetical protein